MKLKDKKAQIKKLRPHAYSYYMQKLEAIEANADLTHTAFAIITLMVGTVTALMLGMPHLQIFLSCIGFLAMATVVSITIVYYQQCELADYIIDKLKDRQARCL